MEHLDSFDAYYESSDYISHRSKADSLFSLLYVWARGLMLIYKYTLLKNTFSPIAACWTSAVAQVLFELYEQKGFDVFGVESNIKARKICLERNIGVQSTESELAPASFDTISLWHVLEHLPHPESSLSTYRGLLSPPVF